MYEAKGDNNRAVADYSKAIQLDVDAPKKATFEVYDSGISDNLNNLAAFYEAQGRYADAESLYKRALAIREKALGPDNPDVSDSLDNLAAFYEAQGRFADAESLYKRALAIREKALGPDNLAVAGTLSKLAAFYEAQGRFADAKSLYKRALAIREKALGPDNPDVSDSLDNLAAFYEAQGRFADAKSLYKRALAIREKALGPENHAVAESLTNLAALYKAQNRYGEAELFYKRALAIREKALGPVNDTGESLNPENDALAVSLNDLSELYRALGRDADAEILFRRARALAGNALKPVVVASFDAESATNRKRRRNIVMRPAAHSHESDNELYKMSTLGGLLNNLPTGNIVLDAPRAMKVADVRKVEVRVGANVPEEVLRQHPDAGLQRVEGILRVSSEPALCAALTVTP